MKKIYTRTFHQTTLMSELPIDFHIHTGPYKIEHTHGYWEIMIVTDNECVNVINGERRALKKYGVQILRPDDLHKILTVGDKEHTHINIEIKENIFLDCIKTCYKEDFCYELLNKARVESIYMNKDDLAYIQKLLHRVQLCGNDFRRWEPYLRQILNMLLLQIIDQKSTLFPFDRDEYDEEVAKSAATVKKALSLMRKKENFDKTVAEICIMLNISEKHLGRLFKEQGKETPGREFRNIKYDYACGLLLTTSIPVLQVMEEIGVWDLGHFNRGFKERYGTTPGVMRKEKSNSSQNNK